MVSALLFEHPVFPILAKLAGLKMISPPEDPIEFQQMYEKIQDPERIMNISPENHDPTKMPFWVADKTGKNTRVVYIFEKVVDSDPLLENFVENVLKS